MTDVAVVTANLGGHDYIHDQAKQTVDADWFYFTDGKHATPFHIWKLEVVMAWGDPRLAAKRFRMTPWDYLADGYRYIVWIDASTQITNENFLAEALEAAGGHALTAWRHPRRTTIGAEAMASLVESGDKYEVIAERMLEQVEAYYARGFADEPPLAATGTLVWNLSDAAWRTRAFMLGAEWLHHCETWTVQDQLSLPYVCWVLNEPLGFFPHSQVDRRYGYGKGRRGPGNIWLRYMDHTRSD